VYVDGGAHDGGAHDGGAHDGRVRNTADPEQGEVSRVPRLRRDERIDLLRKVDLFSSCTRTELARIASISTEHLVGAGDVLTVQGEPGEEFFVIVSGTAVASRDEVFLAALEPTAFFGELALLDGGERTATVVAKTDMRLLVLSRREFFSDHFLVASVARRMMKELGSRLRQTDELVSEAASRSGRNGTPSRWAV
jgi:CRP-like cAMP-binding protein